MISELNRENLEALTGSIHCAATMCRRRLSHQKMDKIRKMKVLDEKVRIMNALSDN